MAGNFQDNKATRARASAANAQKCDLISRNGKNFNKLPNEIAVRGTTGAGRLVPSFGIETGANDAVGARSVFAHSARISPGDLQTY